MKIDHKPGSELMAVTGANGRQILLDREERQALLLHLLEDKAQETIEIKRGNASSSSSAKGTWFGTGDESNLVYQVSALRCQIAYIKHLENDKDALQAHVKELNYRPESCYTSPEQRRALLRHLLEAEALESPEEKNRKQAAQLEDARKMYLELNRALKDEVARLKVELEENRAHTLLLENAAMTTLGINNEEQYGFHIEGDPGEQLFGTLAEAIAATAGIDNREIADLQDTIDRLVAELESTRQARLCELLEAEARERGWRVVFSPADPPYQKFDRLDLLNEHGNCLACTEWLSDGTFHDAEIFWEGQDGEFALHLMPMLNSAALAEKRRRESEDQDV